MGGATLASFLQGPRTTISIHAPRGGSDTVAMVCFNILFDFNPRSPWGERHRQASPLFLPYYFNPRSPWGERPLSVLGSLERESRSRKSLPPRGAWIEIVGWFWFLVLSASRSPHGERGLKLRKREMNAKKSEVAPPTGSVD